MRVSLIRTLIPGIYHLRCNNKMMTMLSCPYCKTAIENNRNLFKCDNCDNIICDECHCNVDGLYTCEECTDVYLIEDGYNKL